MWLTIIQHNPELSKWNQEKLCKATLFSSAVQCFLSPLLWVFFSSTCLCFWVSFWCYSRKLQHEENLHFSADKLKFFASFACVFDESSLKSNVYWTISLMSNIRIYVQQWIPPDLEDQKQFLKHLYNNNLIGFLEKSRYWISYGKLVT